MVSIEKSKLGRPLGRNCSVDGSDEWVIMFGKETCKKCYQARPHKKGHSGMLMATEQELKLMMGKPIPSFNVVDLVPVTKGDKLFSTFYLTHYPGSKGIVGRSLSYRIYHHGLFAGIVSGNSPPHLRVIDERFGKGNLNRILNNNAFRLITNEKNLATQVLREFRKVVWYDYYNRYHEQLLGLITFVEPPLTGACYKADNWEYVGLTKGIHVTKRGDVTQPKVYEKSTKKLIYLFKYDPHKTKWWI